MGVCQFKRNNELICTKDFKRFVALGLGLCKNEIFNGDQILVNDKIKLSELNKNDIIVLKLNGDIFYIGKFMKHDGTDIIVNIDNKYGRFYICEYVGRVDYIIHNRNSIVYTY